MRVSSAFDQFLHLHPGEMYMVKPLANKRVGRSVGWVVLTCTPDFMQLELRLFDPGALKHDLQMIVTGGRDRFAQTRPQPKINEPIIGTERYVLWYAWIFWSRRED